MATESESKPPYTACVVSAIIYTTIKTGTQLNDFSHAVPAAHFDTWFYLGWKVCLTVFSAAIQGVTVSLSHERVNMAIEQIP